MTLSGSNFGKFETRSKHTCLRHQKNVIKYNIKDLIKTTSIFTIETVLEYLKNEPNKFFIYKALNDIIENKDSVVYNKVKGTLVYYNRYYIFQPANISNKQAPLYYRNAILFNKTKSININRSRILHATEL